MGVMGPHAVLQGTTLAVPASLLHVSVFPSCLAPRGRGVSGGRRACVVGRERAACRHGTVMCALSLLFG